MNVMKCSGLLNKILTGITTCFVAGRINCARVYYGAEQGNALLMRAQRTHTHVSDTVSV